MQETQVTWVQSLRKILWRRAWQPTTVFLPGESHAKDYNVWGHKESDMTEATTPALELPEILLESNEKSDLKSRLAHILPAFYLLSPMGRISVISESPGHL